MTNLFISYRRSDSLETVGRLYEHLKPRLKRWEIFYDHMHLQPGSDFPDELRRQVTSATVVIVIIGPDWLKTLNERQGQPGTDHVLEEVRLALQSGNTVLPVLIRNANMPTEKDLDSFPELLPLLRKNGRSVRPDPDFDKDIETIASFLDETILGVGPGLLLGAKYKLVRQIGEGGMGVVYEAVDITVKTSHAKVAVKMILEGMNTKEVLYRFDGEKEALARMKHNHIAKVLDSGTTPQGRPYFVMEFVAGEQITDYCDRKRLTPQERLRLFQKVCSGVQHAHTKGIVHRDIKPSNVLVDEIDGQPVPKVIDFGLAKALTGRLSDRTQETSYNRTVGTLLYMSPEQAAGRVPEIDTRTDVYSLGVLLYELLAGEPPFSSADLQKIGDIAIRDAIIQNNPPSPSAKFSSSHARPVISANRKLDPTKLTKLLKNELEWIPLKAMAKESRDRYETPTQFSDDIDAYLSHERTLAGKPSAAQQLRKYLIRNRRPVIAASLIFAALLSGMIATLWQKRRADSNALTAKTNEGKAVEASQTAQLALVELTKANNLVFDVFEGVDVMEIRADGKPVESVLSDRLVTAGRQLTPETIRDPLVRARLKYRLGKTLISLGDPVNAIELLKAAHIAFEELLDSHHPETLGALSSLATAYQDEGQLDLALQFFEKALKINVATLGREHLDSLILMNNIGLVHLDAGNLDQALPLYEEILPLFKVKLGLEDIRTLDAMNNLAGGYLSVGKLDLAIPIFEEALRLKKSNLGADHPKTLSGMNNLASGYISAGRIDLALPLVEETFTLSKAKLGGVHPTTINCMINLGFLYKATGKLDLAFPLLTDSFALSTLKFGPDHPATLKSMNNLAEGYRISGKLELALPLFDEALKLRKAKLGDDHPDTLSSMNNLALGYSDAGKLDLAIPLFEETFTLRKVILGDDHPDTLTSMNNLALGYSKAGKQDLALPLFEESLKLHKAKLGDDHPNTLNSMNSLANEYRLSRKLDLAIPLFEETFTLRKVKLGFDHPDTLISMNNLALGYSDAGKQDLALPLFEESLKLHKAKLGDDHPNTLTIMNNLANRYSVTRKLDLALPLFEESLKLHKGKLGDDHPNTIKIMNSLASVYRVTGKLDRALPLIEESVKLHKTKLGDDHPFTLETISMLAIVLIDLERPGEAVAIFHEFLAQRGNKAQPSDQNFAKDLASVCQHLLRKKHFELADPLLRECLLIREQRQPDAWTTFNTQSLLGAALLGQKRFSDAEPLLLRGYEGMKAREDTIPANGIMRISESLDRLIDLNTALARPDEIKKYQDLRSKYPAAEETKQ